MYYIYYILGMEWLDNRCSKAAILIERGYWYRSALTWRDGPGNIIAGIEGRMDQYSWGEEGEKLRM